MQIVIVDFGSQYTQVIGRTLRELGVRSVILSPNKTIDWLESNDKPKGIILSGGSASVNDKNAPSLPLPYFWGLRQDVPVLGICYGMQWLAKSLGGIILSNVEQKEYGQTNIVCAQDTLFYGLSKLVVWSSHGDSVGYLPIGFHSIAFSTNNSYEAMANLEKRIWGVQFHPEVSETQDNNRILQNFLEICECQKDWKPIDIVSEIQTEVLKELNGRRAIIGFSGGVDSSTLTAILTPVLGKKLLAICIDTGGLRQNEKKEIKETAKTIGVELKIIRAAEKFQKAIGNTTHSEVKRQRFSKMYGQTLKRVAKEHGAVIIQGSLATDFIESGKFGGADKIKLHHNIGVGGLHPFRNFFKYEIREIAGEIGLPERLVNRQPFPGPGLFVRIVGAPVGPDKLKIVRWADSLIVEILKSYGLCETFSQLIIGLCCAKTVGIKGDKRVYGYEVVVRAVKTSDFMTEVGVQFPDEVRREVSSTITKHPKIVRVWFDETDKPPATTEFE